MIKEHSSLGARDPSSDMPSDVFAAIADLAHREAGLMIPDTKRALVQSRVSRRLRALGLSDFRAYLDLVQSPDQQDERRNLISVLTTNVSSFFREQHHFDALRGVAGDLLAQARTGRRVRIWSAGCSSGQEAFTIAMTLLEVDPGAAELDLRILGTDIDPEILAVARRAVYDTMQISDVPVELRQRYFIERSPQDFEVNATLRKMVAFKELNLLNPWPMTGRFDIIFCRNVVIYFDETTQGALWPRFREVLHTGGTLFVGHSERVPDPTSRGFEPCGVTAYRATGHPSTRTSAP